MAIMHWQRTKAKLCNHFRQHLAFILIVMSMCLFYVDQIPFMSWEKPAFSTSSLVESVLLGQLDSSQCKHVLHSNIAR